MLEGDCSIAASRWDRSTFWQGLVRLVVLLPSRRVSMLEAGSYPFLCTAVLGLGEPIGGRMRLQRHRCEFDWTNAPGRRGQEWFQHVKHSAGVFVRDHTGRTV